MDVWRYSDWYGLGEEIRYSHPHIWQWRDWIVASLNADKGYDRMIEEMLAGDELAPDDPATLRATGFLVRNWDIFNRNAWLANTVEHTARAFLGVTIQCARCHDHKFDPVSQADYYRLRAFFEPYHIRIDRVPGQPDRTKAGLSRVFDDFLETPTYLFVRGDEATPDKSRPLTSRDPRGAGRRGQDHPRLALRSPPPAPTSASSSSARRVEAAEKAVAQATSAAEQAPKAGRASGQGPRRRQGSRPTGGGQDRRGCRNMPDVIKAATADRRRRSRDAGTRSERRSRSHVRMPEIANVGSGPGRGEDGRPRTQSCHAEWLEDQGAKDERFRGLGRARPERALRRTAPGWRFIEARFNRQLACRDLNRARAQARWPARRRGGTERRSLQGRSCEGRGGARRGPRSTRRCGASSLAKAEAAAKAPLTTAYTPRPLEFPRAKTTYRDTPSNAPYSKGQHWPTSRPGPLDRRPPEPADGARRGQPRLGAAFRRASGRARCTTFGLRTPRPEHHALLDWLAVEFMESGWSFKHLHRLIVTSRAYRMRSSDSGPDDPNVNIDPDNRYVWRMNVSDGWKERSSATAFCSSPAGSTRRWADPSSPSPPPRPALAERFTTATPAATTSRSSRMFDAANVTECYRRHETIVPQQALALIQQRDGVNSRQRHRESVIDREVGERPGRPRCLRRLGVRAHSRPGANRGRAIRVHRRASTDWLRRSRQRRTRTATPEARARSALVHVLLEPQ